MATAYLVLGNSTPGAAASTTLVTGSTNGSIISSFNACNRGGSNDSIRVSITKSGGSAYYLFYNYTIPSSGSLVEQAVVVVELAVVELAEYYMEIPF